MLWCIHVTVDNVVFATYKHSRRAIESIGCCKLPTRYLHEKVRPRVGRFAPFSYDVIETEVKLVICEHLCGGEF